MSYRDFRLSNIGWTIAAFVAILGYVAYYIWFYPAISAISFNQSFTSRQDILPDIEVNMISPIYLASYKSGGEVSITVRNLSTSQSISGEVVVNPLLLDKSNNPWPLGVGKKSIQGLVFDGVQKQADTLVFSNLQAGHSQDFLLQIQLPSDQITHILITLEIIVDGQPAQILNWEGKGYPWPKSTSCGNDEINFKGLAESNGPNEQVCLEQNSYGVFTESALDQLLLPPFSNYLLPFLAFGLVWFVEQVLPSEWLTGNMYRRWTWFYTLLLFLLSSGFLWIISYLTLVILQHVSDGYPTYFLILFGLITGLALFRFIFFLIRGAGWGKAHRRDEEAIIRDLESIDAAYDEDDLLSLKRLQDSYTLYDLRHQRAHSRYTQLHHDLIEDYVEAMIAFLRNREYIEALEKTKNLIEERPSLSLLPDNPYHQLHDLLFLPQGNGVCDSAEKGGWEFNPPENYGQKIYEVLLAELKELTPSEWHEKNNCQKLGQRLKEGWPIFVRNQLEELQAKNCPEPDDAQQ